MLLLSQKQICYVIINMSFSYCKLKVHLKMLLKVDTSKEDLTNFFANISQQVFGKTKS